MTNCKRHGYFKSSRFGVDINTHHTGDFALAKLLLEAGPDYNAASGSGDTPLIAACGQGNFVSITKLLIEAGANVSATNFVATPLHIACMKGHTQMAKELIFAGADRAPVDGKGNTPSDLATKRSLRTLLAPLAKGAM